MSTDSLASFQMVASTGGNDTITGGANSTNTIWGDAWQMFSSTGGNDNLTGNGAIVYGDGGYMSSSTGGDDIITGGASSLSAYGDAGVMSFPPREETTPSRAEEERRICREHPCG